MNYGIKYWLINQCQQNPDTMICGFFNWIGNALAPFALILMLAMGVGFLYIAFFKSKEDSLKTRIAWVCLGIFIFGLLGFVFSQADILLYTGMSGLVGYFIFGKEIREDK